MLMIQPDCARTETDYRLALAACLGALLALRLAGLYAADTDRVFDEAQYWGWSRKLDFGYFSKPPMIAWLIRATSAICGDGEACIRAASPVLYSFAAVMPYLTGRALYDARIGFWSAIVFATLPGLSYSTNLITTDVPLILFWTIMLYAWAMLVERRSMGLAVLLGVAIGLGLLAKQAMVYAVLCIACHVAVSREAREALQGGRGLVAGAIVLALFSSNLIWNAEHDFPTARHNAANIGWQFPYIHPLQLLQFIGAQFGVFGPILFVVLLRGAWREFRVPSDSGKVLLLAFSLPVLVLLAMQAMLSRAHANWGATAYPAASIFVTAVLLQLNRQMLFRISLGLHLAFAVALAAAPAFARQWPVFERFKFTASVLGWREASEAVQARLGEEHYGSLLVDSREAASELLYYLRDVSVPLYVWPSSGAPKNHYEMTRPFGAAAPEPVLFVSLTGGLPRFDQAFGSVTALGSERVVLVRDAARVLHFCRLADYKQAPSARRAAALRACWRRPERRRP